MALGQFTDDNLALASTLSEGTWSAAHPLANLVGGDYLGHPARCEDPADLAKSQFKAVLEWPRKVTLIAVLFHTLSINARYRLTIADLDGGFDEPKLQTEWTPVVPALWKSSELAWESPNWWTGRPLATDLELYPPHLWIAVPEGTIVSAFRLEFDDGDNPAGYFDMGGLWIASGWSPAINFERGRQVGVTSRSQVDEAPSGRRFSEERRSRRRLTTAYKMLTSTDARRWLDAAMRAGVTRPVLFVPDIDDPLALFREAFPGTFETPPSPVFTYEGLHQVDITFEEIIA